jgi:hypothetical protein
MYRRAAITAREVIQNASYPLSLLTLPAVEKPTALQLQADAAVAAAAPAVPAIIK